MERAAAGRPAYLVESVDRAMQVIERLQVAPTLSLTELADHLHVAPSTAHRLLSTMAHRQVVRQDPDTKGWSLGPALLQAGLAAVARLDIRRVARPELEALARALEETVHLARLDGDHVLFLDTVESTRAVRVTDRTGVRLPAHSTASGKVLLAQLDRAELRRLLPERLPAVTPRTRTSRASLERELATIRRRGFALNVAESERGLTAVAAAVPDLGATTHVSVTVSLPSEHTPKAEVERIGHRVVATASRVADLLHR